MAALVALIVGEAVTNAITHAHPTGVEGKIAVECKQDAKGAIVICVTDDGVGLPVDFDPAQDGTAGFRVMRALSERLGAKLTFKSTSLGLQVRLRVQNTGFDSKTDGFAAEPNGRGNGADAGPGVARSRPMPRRQQPQRIGKARNCSRPFRPPCIRRTPAGASPSTMPPRARFGAAAPSWARANSADRGNSTGPMARRCRTTSVRWRWRSSSSGRSAAWKRSPSVPTARAFP